MAPLIDTPRNRALAQRLADLTGQTPEQAAEQALQQWLTEFESRDRERSVEEKMAIDKAIGEAQALFSGVPMKDDRQHGEILYDDSGLPS